MMKTIPPILKNHERKIPSRCGFINPRSGNRRFPLGYHHKKVLSLIPIGLLIAWLSLPRTTLSGDDHGHDHHGHNHGTKGSIRQNTKPEADDNQKISSENLQPEPGATVAPTVKGNGDDHEDHPRYDPHEDHGTHNDHEDHGHHEGEPGHSDEITLSDEAITLFAIKTAPAQRVNLERKIAAPARVVFNTENMAHLSTTVSGRVSDIKYRIGDSVRTGDILLVLNSTELGMRQNEYLQKRREIESARVILEVAEIEYQRGKTIVAGKGISQAEFLRIEGQYKIAKTSLLIAESAAQSWENNLKLLGMNPHRIEALIASGEVDPVYSISSPIDGVIIARNMTIGEVVNPDDDALMTVADLRNLWAIVSVPESQVRLVELGARAEFHSDAIGNETITGMVTYIAPALDERTRTGQVRIEIPHQEGLLRPGMFGHVRIFPKAEHHINKILAVPLSAVFTVEGDTAVFVTVSGEKNTFQKRRILAGPRVDDHLPVVSGLQENEQIVVNGGFILKAELGKEGVAHEH